MYVKVLYTVYILLTRSNNQIWNYETWILTKKTIYLSNLFWLVEKIMKIQVHIFKIGF